MSTTLIDRLVIRCVRDVAQRPSYFTKQEVVREVLGRHDLGTVLREIRQGHPGYGLDQCIVGYVGARVSEELQQRDTYGIRLYECYRDGQGTFRWRQLKTMTRKDLDRVLTSIDTHIDHLQGKRQTYRAFREALVGTAKTVGDIYEQVVTRLGLDEAAS